VKPAPKATNITVEPSFTRPCACASLERDRDRRRRGVPVAIDVHEHLLHRDVRVLRRRLDDADVRLMRDEQIDVGRGELRPIERAVRRIGHRAHRILEDLASRHRDEVRALGEDLVGHRAGAGALGPLEEIGQGAVGAHVRREDPALLGAAP